MVALKEFANFITHNKATLTATYARLLAEYESDYENFSRDSRIALARRLLKAVGEAFQTEQFDPLVALFADADESIGLRWGDRTVLPNSLAEIECLGQTLTPVVTNLDAGKFLWQMLAEVRSIISTGDHPKPSPLPSNFDKNDALDTSVLLEQKYKELSENKYRTILDSIEDGYYEVDLAGNLTFFNDALCDVLGYPPDKLMGMNNRQYTDETNAKLLYQTFNQIYRTDKPVKGFIWEVIRQDGRKAYIETSTSLMKDEQGEPIGFRGVARDVTERRHVEEVLGESEERLRLLLDSSPDPIVMYDDVGNTVYVNLAFEQTFGWSRQELLGSRIDFVPEESLTETQEALQELFEKGHLLRFETKRLTKNGQILDVEQSGSVYKDRQGNVGGIIVFIRDISIRKQEQVRLAKRATELETVAQVSAAVSTILDASELLRTVATLTKESFDLSAVHIYLLNETEDALILTTRVAEVGQQITDDKWHIPLEPEDFLVARAACTHQGVVDNDLQPGWNYRLDSSLSDARAELAVPIMVSDKVLGVLDVHSDEAHRFTDGDLHVQKILATEIAVALQNAQTYGEIKRRVSDLETVAQVATAVSTILDPSELLQTVVNLTKQRFGLYHVHIYLLDDRRETLSLAAGAGEVGQQMVSQGWRIPFHQEVSIVARAARNQQTLVVNNVQDSTGFFPNPLLPDTRAEIAVPLMVGGRVLGVLDAQADKPDYFTEEDVRLQTILAAQIAIALQNAQQYDQTQIALAKTQVSQEELAEFSERLQQLQIITQNLARELKPGPEVYYEAIGAMTQLLKARYAALALLDQEGNYLQFIHYGISDEQSDLIGNLPTGRGLLGALLQEEKPIRIKDIQIDHRFAGFPKDHPKMKSFLGLPIVFQDRLLGRLYFTEAESGEFDADDETLANSFVTSLAGTLQSVDLFRQTEAARRQSERQAAEIGMIDSVSQTLISEPDLGIALHAVTNIMVEYFDAAFARLWTLDDTGQTLLLKASSGMYTHLDGGHAQVPVGKFKIGLIAEERQAHLTNNILNDPRLGDPAWAKREGMVAFAGYPLLAGNRLIGVLAMFARQPLPDEVLNILERLADRAAVAIDNRRLLEEAERRASREQTIREITDRLRSAPNLERLLEIATKELGQRLSATHAKLELGIEMPASPADNGKTTTN